MADLIGKSLGRYHVLEPLGQGGMASVYKAYDTSLERNVAIKIIRADVEEGNPAEFLKRFQREARALAQLDHPYILKVLDYGEQDGIPYLVMPFVPGGTLKQKMGVAMPYQQAAALLAPIARALEYAHEQKIIHRDVKPANILISQSGAPLLSDFGIAKIISGGANTQLTATGVGIGTPDYMAPEQWMGVADPGTDIYSLGVVYYEMVTGHRPYTADTPAAVMVKHLRDPLPRPNTFVHDLPDVVEQVLFKALAKEPENRYQSMAAFASAMEKLERGEQNFIGAAPQNLETIRSMDKTVLDQTGKPVATRLATPATVAAAAPAAKRKMETWQIAVLGLVGLGVVALICVLAGGALFASRTFMNVKSTTEPATVSSQAGGLPGSTAPATEAAGSGSASSTSSSNVAATSLPKPTEAPTALAPLTSIEGYPTDVPFLKDNNGDLTTSVSQGMNMFTFSSNLSPADLATFYTSGMKTNGWQIINQTTQVNAKMWVFMKNETRSVIISISQTGEKSMISIMIPPTQ